MFKIAMPAVHKGLHKRIRIKDYLQCPTSETSLFRMEKKERINEKADRRKRRVGDGGM